MSHRLRLESCSCILGFSVAISLAAAACSGSSGSKSAMAPAAASSEPKDDVVRPITNGQLKIAHYASGDGMTGLVLDRSGDRPKVQFDKQKDIVELTMIEDSIGGQRRGWYMKSPDGKNVLYLSSGGELKTWNGHDEIYLSSDKPAAALPAPTVAGQYVAPKSAYEIQKEKILALALQTKTPELASEDSGNLAKVRDVLASAPADVFVRLTEAGAQRARYAPASKKIGSTIQGLGGILGGFPFDEKWDPKASGLAKYGGKLVPMQIQYGDPNRLRLHMLAGWTDRPVKGTPGVIWEGQEQVVFVTVDGGRYELSIPNEGGDLFEKGAGTPASWPAPLQHALLDVDTMRALGKASIAAAEATAVEQADDAWWKCVNDVWTKTKDQLDKNEASSASTKDKSGRASGILKSAELEAPKKCESTKQKLEKILLRNIEERVTQRTAIFEKVRARF